MKPQHISELIAELIATGKLPPEEKRAKKAKIPQVKPDWNYGIIGNGTTTKPALNARQLKPKLN